MNAIPDDVFLAWAAVAGLVPDSRYPASRRQLVFERAQDCWRSWRAPEDLNQRRLFITAALSAFGSGMFRVRLRGGGAFRAPQVLNQGRELAAAMGGLLIPEGPAGALEFGEPERSALAELAVAFLSFGYRVETDLELVPESKTACLPDPDRTSRASCFRHGRHAPGVR